MLTFLNSFNFLLVDLDFSVCIIDFFMDLFNVFLNFPHHFHIQVYLHTSSIGLALVVMVIVMLFSSVVVRVLHFMLASFQVLTYLLLYTLAL